MFARVLVLCIAIALLALALPAAAPRLLAYLQPQEVAVATAESDGPQRQTSIAIPADESGHFRTDAQIDGRTIPVVIDTGATTVALSPETAHRLGLQLTPADFTATVRTASGTVRAAPVELHSVRVGNVTVRDVSAVVIEGDTLELNLLGMSFLNRLTRFEAGGGQLVLVQ
jgi:aspartyl protease family protein